MKVMLHDIANALAVDLPGDVHFLNCLHSFETKAPRCAGVVSGAAKIVPTKVSMTAPKSGCRVSMTFEKIICPATCPRDKHRCLIDFYEG